MLFSHDNYQLVSGYTFVFRVQYVKVSCIQFTATLIVVCIIWVSSLACATCINNFPLESWGEKYLYHTQKMLYLEFILHHQKVFLLLLEQL